MAKIKITQIRGVVKHPRKQKETIKALGLRRINQTVVLEDTPQIQGMLKKVKHLIKVESK